MHGLAAKLHFVGEFLLLGIGGHDGTCRRVGCLGGCVKRRHELRNAALDRLDGQRNADDAGGCDDDIVRRNAQRLRQHIAGGARLIVAVGVAGVRVAGVTDGRARLAVCKMRTGHANGRGEDLVGRINAGCRAVVVSHDQRQITLRLVLAEARMHARCLESGRCADAALAGIDVDSHGFILHFKKFSTNI